MAKDEKSCREKVSFEMDALETRYDKFLKRYGEVVTAMTALSQGSAGVPSETSRHYWASVLYTKLTGCALSILRLLPRNRISISKIEFWEFSPIASLARDLSECSIAYYYLAADDIPAEEWECRWNIFNMHDCLRRIKLFRYLSGSDAEVSEFEEQAEELKERLLNNSYFKGLSAKVQSQCLRAEKLYLLTQDEIVPRMGFDPDLFRGLYLLWSSHVHSFPIGFYRLGDNKRGTGLENNSDKRYITMTLEINCELIQNISKEHLRMFPGADRHLLKASKKALFG